MYKELSFGAVGDEVKILQAKLKQLGFYSATITGSFGRSTEEGVLAFQKEVGLEQTGVVDEATWETLLNYTTPAIAPISVFPTLSLGSSGSAVTDLQTKLKALLYYTGPSNGDFDLETENSVKRFQLNNGLTANGKVDDATWNKINSLYGNLNPCAIEDDIPETNDETTYTVQSGDTLYAIARKFNTTVDELKRLNNLTSNTLQIGQVLKIPQADNPNYFTYTVVSGDTLYGIARKYDTTVDVIKQLNNLSSNTLSIGQTLKIPNQNEENYISYVVSSGDTLYAIARRYNTSVDAIKSLNNLTSNTLQIGQVLKIPTSLEESYITYIVRQGDTLYSIANRYNISVDTLKNFNNLASNNLSIGQSLKIPV